MQQSWKTPGFTLGCQENGGTTHSGRNAGVEGSFVLLGKRKRQPRGLTRKEESQSTLKSNFKKLENIIKANVVHMHHQKYRIQAGPDLGLYFALGYTKGHVSLTYILEQHWGRGTPRNKALAPQIANTHIFSPPVELLPGNHTDPK